MSVCQNLLWNADWSSFKNKFDAADHFIKCINKLFDQEFEPMKDEDGSRFFLDIYENPDYEKAIEYASNLDYYTIEHSTIILE